MAFFIEGIRIDKLNNKKYPVSINIDSIEAIEPDIDEEGKTLITCKNYYAQIDEPYETVKYKIRMTVESQQNHTL